MNSGAVLLSEVARVHRALDVACKRCDRRGRYRVSTLIARYGAGTGLPEVAERLEEGCPRKGRFYDGCFCYFPDLTRQPAG